jgi:hypothetical protein
MLQNTGRVYGAPYRDSYALRSSPFVCIIDTLLMLFKFVWMTAVGCSFRVAARHVWYDRFEEEGSQFRDTVRYLFPGYGDADESDGAGAGASAGDSSAQKDKAVETHIDTEKEKQASGNPDTANHRASTCGRTRPDIENGSSDIGERSTSSSGNASCSRHLPGSTVDGMWRLNIAGFILGVLPQVIKIFSMRGIPWTRMLVAFSISSFVVTETFRVIAGPAGAVNLHPMPVVVNVKKALS